MKGAALVKAGPAGRPLQREPHKRVGEKESKTQVCGEEETTRLRIKIVHRDITLGPDGVGHRACILLELGSTEPVDVSDTLDRSRVEVGRELLVAEHSEPFFERELEPVPAAQRRRARFGTQLQISNKAAPFGPSDGK